jgi:hypothetical protein
MFDTIKNLFRAARGERLRIEVQDARTDRERMDDFPTVLPIKSGRDFFEMQCKFGHTELEEGRGLVA